MMSNLWVRVLAGAIGIPVAVGAIVLGGWWFNVAVIVVTALALREFYHLAASKNARANQSVGLAWSVVVQVLVAVAVGAEGFEGLTWFGFAILAFLLGLLATMIAELWRARENPILNTGITITGVTYVSSCMSTLFVLRETRWPITQGTVGDAGAALVLTLFGAVWACDTVAYFVGIRYGKHKLFPRVSPAKSWEGALAGFLAAAAGFWAFSMWLMPDFPTWLALTCGALVGVVGQLGDLAESLLKRDATIKDSSHLIPGHGGLLDRFDSMLFAAPMVLILLTIVSSVGQ
jgi:phosphatidate cytidylyltransferase